MFFSINQQASDLLQEVLVILNEGLPDSVSGGLWRLVEVICRLVEASRWLLKLVEDVIYWCSLWRQIDTSEGCLELVECGGGKWRIGEGSGGQWREMEDSGEK